MTRQRHLVWNWTKSKPMPKTNRKYCTPPKDLRNWLEHEAQRLNVSESAILVQALDRYRWDEEARMRRAMAARK